MHRGMKGLLWLSLLGATAMGVQEDTTIVETPGADDLPGTRLEDQPEVAPLPDWLIDIPPEQAGPSAQANAQRVLREYVEADEHVVSDSRMFSVSGGSSLRVGAIAAHADELRARLNRLLELGNTWKYAIAIRLHGTTASPVRQRPIRPSVRIISGQPNLLIRIHVGGGINLQRLDEAIISMLLYEYALRHVRPDALPDYISLPPWLATGIQQAMLWQTGTVDRKLYQNLFSKGEMMSPEQIVNTEDPARLDAGSRQLYEVSCGVLIMSLLHRRDGAGRLRNLLAEALTQEGEAKQMIAEHFHEMEAEGNNFSKWWALELAALAQPQVMEVLTPLDTEKQLREALMITGVHPDTQVPYTVSIADVAELVKVPNWRDQMRACTDRLTALSMRCFPGYRGIIMEYFRAIGELLQGAKPDDVQKSIEPLRELREAYIQAATRGRDYLDWFEITQLGHRKPDNFDAYLEAMRRLRRETPGPDTPMSRYLDDIEALYCQKEGDPLPEQIKKQVPRPTTKP